MMSTPELDGPVHGFARELDISPWEALLKSVRIAAGKSAYCEMVLAGARSNLELEGRVTRLGEGRDQLLMHPDTGEPLGVGQFTDLSFWVRKSELWHDRLTRCAKTAVEAGVAAWEVQRAETEANTIVRVLNATLDAIEGEISEGLAIKMRGVMRKELLAIDDERVRQRDDSSRGTDIGPGGVVMDGSYRDS